MKTPPKQNPKERPNLRQRQAQTPDQGYDEDRDLGEIGYIEPGGRRARSRAESARRTLSRAREEARSFWKLLAELPGVFEAFPPEEQEIIIRKFSYVEPSTGTLTQPTKRVRRTRAQVISDLADEYERDVERRAFYQKKRGRPRVKYARELAAELARRAESRAKSGGISRESPPVLVETSRPSSAKRRK